MTYKTRKRVALVILLVALPLYIVSASMLMTLFDRPHPLLEFLVYVLLGVAWALPLKRIFKGIGKADPDTARDA